MGTGGLDITGEYVLRQISQYTGARYIFLTCGETGESEGGLPGSVSHHTGALQKLPSSRDYGLLLLSFSAKLGEPVFSSASLSDNQPGSPDLYLPPEFSGTCSIFICRVNYRQRKRE